MIKTVPKSLAADVVRTEGWGALFAGLTPRCGKVAPACGLMIACYEGMGGIWAGRRESSYLPIDESYCISTSRVVHRSVLKRYVLALSASESPDSFIMSCSPTRNDVRDRHLCLCPLRWTVSSGHRPLRIQPLNVAEVRHPRLAPIRLSRRARIRRPSRLVMKEPDGAARIGRVDREPVVDPVPCTEHHRHASASTHTR